MANKVNISISPEGWNSLRSEQRDLVKANYDMIEGITPLVYLYSTAEEALHLGWSEITMSLADFIADLEAGFMLDSAIEPIRMPTIEFILPRILPTQAAVDINRIRNKYLASESLNLNVSNNLATAMTPTSIRNEDQLKLRKNRKTKSLARAL